MFDKCLNLAKWQFTSDSPNFNPSWLNYHLVTHINFNKMALYYKQECCQSTNRMFVDNEEGQFKSPCFNSPTVLSE